RKRNTSSEPSQVDFALSEPQSREVFYLCPSNGCRTQRIMLERHGAFRVAYRFRSSHERTNKVEVAGRTIVRDHGSRQALLPHRRGFPAVPPPRLRPSLLGN